MARSAVRPLAVLVGAVLLLTGCRLELTVDTEVAADGSGTAAIEARFDSELLDELDRLEVDPTAELEAVAAETPGWEVERTLADDGALTVRLEREVDDAAAIGDAYRELGAGLSDADPAMLVDLELAADEQGAGSVEGTAEFRPPRSAGVSVDGEPVGPDEEELEALVAEAVDTELAVTLPGPIVEEDGDAVDGRTVSWELAADEPRTITARSDPPTWWSQLPPAALIGGSIGIVAVLVGVLLWWWSRRRSRRREVSPAG